MTTLSPLLIEAPASDAAIDREPLAYVDAYDAVAGTDHAFVAFKETHRTTGAWWVRINALRGPHSVFHPNAVRLQARAASAQGKPWFTWGYALTPTASDPREIAFRVHVRDGQPTAVEMILRMRSFDTGGNERRTVSFPWPAS